MNGSVVRHFALIHFFFLFQILTGTFTLYVLIIFSSVYITFFLFTLYWSLIPEHSDLYVVILPSCLS